MRRRPLIIGSLVSAACLAGFWELAEDFACSPAVIAFDESASAAIQSLRTPAMTALMKSATLLAGTAVVVVLTLALVVVLWLRQRRIDAVFVALAVSGGALLSTAAKGHFGRERPLTENALIALPASASFPSGHTMASLCLGFATGYLALRSEMRPAAKYSIIAVCVLYALLAGVSRVYLGVHWPSDVIASWLLGGAWLALLTGVVESARASGDRSRPFAGASALVSQPKGFV